METSCDCDVGDTIEPYNEHFPVARRPYVCCECRQVIRPGEKYHHAWGVLCFTPVAYKTCLPCSRIRRDYGCGFGSLREDVRNCLGVEL